jgi:hypothetical protein
LELSLKTANMENLAVILASPKTRFAKVIPQKLITDQPFSLKL